MTFCKNCGTPLEEGINFCNNCGTPVQAPQPQPQNFEATTQVPYEPAQPQVPFEPQAYETVQPLNIDPYANPYVQPQAPQSTVAGKVMGIIGMVLGIEGLITAIFLLIFNFILLGICGESYYTSDLATYPAMMLSYDFIGLATGIAALILSSKARNKGNTSAMPGVAKGMGIPTIILSGISIFLALMALTMVA